MKKCACAEDHDKASKVCQQCEGKGGYKGTGGKYADYTGKSHWKSRAAVVAAFLDEGNSGGRHQKCTGAHHHRESSVCAHAEEKDKRHTGSIQADACRHQSAENKIADNGGDQRSAV